MATTSSTATLYGRGCTVCRHADLFEIDQALVDNVPVSQISRDYDVSTDALYRHTRWHLGPALKQRLTARTEFSAASMAERIVSIADDARQARVTAYALGNRREGARLGDAELRAVNVLMDRLHIDHDDVSENVAQATAVGRALGALVRSHPELGRELGDVFDADGHGDLAEYIRAEAHKSGAQQATREVAE